MGWFIIIVMVMGVGGIISAGINEKQDAVEPTKYNGYDFYEQYGQWSATIRGQQYLFLNSPMDLENISIPLNINSWLAKEKVYLAYVPNDQLVVDSYIQLLGAVLYQNGIIPQQACAVEKDCPDIPVINCEKEGVILLSGDETIISQDNNCLILQATDDLKMQKLTERVAYQILGVII